ncbi:hypothetical protein PF005_g7070 [Phytophthora fragariae]|uniref:Uncharacterized protein n=2 Tax=Phytophthora TaxID=4783 RepID=A0A6A3YNG1_9STRA|nr:hypothetical protein PF003_g13869 [Phytophthora fragariae]KAE9025915.1 hypothetical protein PR002_g11051 [Phytophthora rubi]KAE8939936.1 hypothetical protein PF009_g10232 [Phytophthora fragariae]KAE9005847.1 hypothetical protein PF011_g11849 [Phytophthora fragariae]KAE9090783.1 hypothetical protein PF010_g18456 [Phytophthora fragariae]
MQRQQDDTGCDGPMGGGSTRQKIAHLAGRSSRASKGRGGEMTKTHKWRGRRTKGETTSRF